MQRRSLALVVGAVARCALARVVPQAHGSARLMHASSAALRRKRTPPREQQHMSEEDRLAEAEEQELLRQMSPEERAYLKLSMEQMEHYFKVARQVNEQQEMEREEQQRQRRQRQKRRQKDQVPGADARPQPPPTQGGSDAAGHADTAAGALHTPADTPHGVSHVRMEIPDLLSRKELPRMDLSRPTGTSFLESKQAAAGVAARVELVDDANEAQAGFTENHKLTEDGLPSSATSPQGDQPRDQPEPERAKSLDAETPSSTTRWSRASPRAALAAAETATAPASPIASEKPTGRQVQELATNGHSVWQQSEASAAGHNSGVAHGAEHTGLDEDATDEDVDYDDGDDDDDDDVLEELLMRGDAEGAAEVPIKEVTFSLGKPRHQRRTKDERWEGSARHRRVADAIAAAIEATVYKHHLDPLFVKANLTIYDVDVKRSFRTATVYWTAAFSQDPEIQQQQEAAIAEALDLHTREFRRSVARTLRIKHTPRLVFRRSMVEEEDARLEALLREGLGREPRPVHIVMQEAQEAANAAKGGSNAKAHTPQQGPTN